MVILRSELSEQEVREPKPRPRLALAANVFPKNALLFIYSLLLSVNLPSKPVFKESRTLKLRISASLTLTSET